MMPRPTLFSRPRSTALLLGVCLASTSFLAGDVAVAGGPVTYSTVVRQNPAQRLFVARIDLSDRRVRVVVAAGGPDPDGPGPWETVLRTTSATARAAGLAVAVNGVFFSHPADDDGLKYAAGAPARGSNLVVIDGQTMTHARDGAALVIDADGHASVADLADGPPPGARQVIGGSGRVLAGGRVLDSDDARHPRTAAGLADGGRTLVLLVADGKRPGWAAGLSLRELGEAMAAQGCVDAINLDGGGSSTMVRRDPGGRTVVVNTPSDGSTFVVPLSVERPVAFVLGVRVAAPP